MQAYLLPNGRIVFLSAHLAADPFYAGAAPVNDVYLGVDLQLHDTDVAGSVLVTSSTVGEYSLNDGALIHAPAIPAGMVIDGAGGFKLPDPPYITEPYPGAVIQSQSATLRGEIPELQAYYDDVLHRDEIIAASAGVDRTTLDCWLVAMNTWTANDLKNGTGTGCNIAAYIVKQQAITLVQHYDLVLAEGFSNNNQLSQAIVDVRTANGPYEAII